MKRFRRILAIGCVLCIIVTSTVICLAATVRAPKPDGQNKKLWCWATAAKLVAENNGGAWIDSTAAVLSDTNGLHSGPRDNDVCCHGCQKEQNGTVTDPVGIYMRG